MTLRPTIFQILAIIALLGSASVAESELLKLDRPMRIVLRTVDGEQVEGMLTAYDDRQFELHVADDDVRVLAWSALPAQRVLVIHQQLLPPRDGNAWLDLGRLLRSLPDGEGPSDQALARAQRIDPQLQEQVQRIRSGETADQAEGANGQQGVEEAGAIQGPPEVQGPTDLSAWGTLTEAQHEQAVAQLKQFAWEGLQQVGVRARLLETKYFLFYTDLPDDEAVRWAKLLDKMYARLGKLFGVAEGENIWWGKCLIIVFTREQDYHLFEHRVHGSDSFGTAGRCRSYGNGAVHVTFYRQQRESAFAHVLVHEAVHGFLHRYKTPVHIPSWLNEGLADTIAGELVPQDRSVPLRQRISKRELRRRGSLEDFFVARQIQAWQYGLASSLTTFMIQQNKRGYVDMINGIKAGQPWYESITKNYGVSPERLIRVFGETQAVENLTLLP